MAEKCGVKFTQKLFLMILNEVETGNEGFNGTSEWWSVSREGN